MRHLFWRLNSSNISIFTILFRLESTKYNFKFTIYIYSESILFYLNLTCLGTKKTAHFRCFGSPAIPAQLLLPATHLMARNATLHMRKDVEKNVYVIIQSYCIFHILFQDDYIITYTYVGCVCVTGWHICFDIHITYDICAMVRTCFLKRPSIS